jgi:predicted AlkP superfamily phosphohydrolase/phosphomutase
MGLLATARAHGGSREESVRGGTVPGRDLASRVRGLIPQRLRIAVSDALLSREMKERLSLRWKTAGISWERTRAYTLENANEGYVRINLKGRERLGTVEPGVEYERLRDQIHDAAAHLINPLTGRRAVHAVYRTDDICQGPRRADMPDVVIIWDPDARVTTDLTVGEHGAIRTRAASSQLPPFYSGNHFPNAFAVAVGPDVRCGQHAGRSVLDLAPTVLDAFGVPPPPHMPGVVLAEMHQPVADGGRSAEGARSDW